MVKRLYGYSGFQVEVVIVTSDGKVIQGVAQGIEVGGCPLVSNVTISIKADVEEVLCFSDILRNR